MDEQQKPEVLLTDQEIVFPENKQPSTLLLFWGDIKLVKDRIKGQSIRFRQEENNIEYTLSRVERAITYAAKILERIDPMSNKDQVGKELHIEDVVKTTEDVGEILTGTEGIVVQKIDDDNIIINPINVGQPFQILSSKVTVVYSFVETLLGLKDEEAFAKILMENESRFETSQTRKKIRVAKVEEVGETVDGF